MWSQKEAMDSSVVPRHMKKPFLDILIFIIGSRNDDGYMGSGDTKFNSHSRLCKLGRAHEFALGGLELVQIHQQFCAQWQI